MSNRLGISWFLLLISFHFFSCSTNNKGLLNREYRSLISKYNILFNGKESFSIGETILEEAFEDNFYDLIKVEPINLRGENIDNSTIVPGFDRAEEKARNENYIILSNSMNKPHGMRECYIFDNNGFCWVPSILV